MTVASMTKVPSRPSRQPRAVRRVGYVFAVLFNAAGLCLVNLWPGWDAVPFLTADTRQVLGIVNTVLITSLAVNLLYLFTDPRWLVALGGLVTSVLGLIGLIRIWEVFPFAFGNSSVDWALLVHIGLVVGIAGSCIAILVQLVQLARALVRRH
jgi:hypothetical protein